MTSFSDINVNLISEDEEASEKHALVSKKSTVRLTSMRWLILFLGSLVALVNGFQNLQFAGAEIQFIAFYQVSNVLGDLLTQAYYISFVILALPVIWLITKFGLRFTVLSAALLSFISSVLTAISVFNRDFFAMALASEFIAGTSQIFILSYPSLLAGAWFASNELSTASGTIVFFYELGNGLALLLPPLAIPNKIFNQTLGSGAIALLIAVAAIALVALVMISLFFENKPEHPPNYGQLNAESRNVTSFRQSIFNLLSNGNFLLLFFSFGIDTGIFSACTSLLKAIISDEFPYISDATTGQIVAFLIITGTAAPILCGMVLDKTKKFLIGFTGKMSVGFETAAEITYPEPESTSSGLLMWSTCVFTTIFIQIIRFLLTLSSFYANIFITFCAVVSFLLTCFMRPDLRRLRANYEAIEDKTVKR